MVEKLGPRRGDAFEAALANVLEAAAATLTLENAEEAAQAAKAVSALIAAQRALADLAGASAEPEDLDDRHRAELRRRIARFVEADLAGAPPEVLERIAGGGAQR